MENVRSDVRPKTRSDRPKPSIKAFLLSQASDPVLAAACEPAQSKFGAPVQPLKKRRR